MRNILVLILLIFNCLAASTLHAANTTSKIDKIIVFGDSLSDNRNFYELTQCYMPYSPYENGKFEVYYDGRFTNGLVWAEYLAQDLGINIGNAIDPNDTSSTCPKHQKSPNFPDFAYAGTWASDDIPAGSLGLVSLSWEINEFLESQSKHGYNNQNELIVMWIGANDYLDGRLKETLEQATDKTINAIDRALDLLLQDGNRNILVLNLPDLGKTPVIMDAGKEISARVSQLSSIHNQKLSKVVNTLQQRYPEAKLMLFDTTTRFNDLVTHPEKYHFTNTTEACYTGDYASESEDGEEPFHAENHVCQNPSSYLYWDHTHPSTAVHRLLAGYVKSFLATRQIA